LPWNLETTNAFRRNYKKLSSEIKERAYNALESLSNVEDPRALGELKYGKWKGAYSYEIGRQYRILYAVDFNTRSIILLNIGSHKIY
jgi:addiction module RelE/StbE family toxin